VVGENTINRICDALASEQVKCGDVRVASCEKIGTKFSDVLFERALEERPGKASVVVLGCWSSQEESWTGQKVQEAEETKVRFKKGDLIVHQSHCLQQPEVGSIAVPKAPHKELHNEKYGKRYNH
jgi:hypothetical protein